MDPYQVAMMQQRLLDAERTDRHHHAPKERRPRLRIRRRSST